MVLIVDEAQNLERDVLEEIRLLGNLEDRYGKLLQIVLAGQPELDRKLDAPDLRQLKQRIVLRCSLRPLSEKETLEYVATRLERAGMPGQTVFPRHVLTEIHGVAQGVPRVINAICDNLLVMTCALGQKVATTQMLAKVGDEMRLDGFSGAASKIGPAADPAESAAITRYKSKWTSAPRTARSEFPIAPAMASGVTVKPLPPLPARPRRAVRSAVWIAAAALASLGGLTLGAANDLWGIRQLVPGLWPQVTSAHYTLPEPTSYEPTSYESTSPRTTSEPSWTQPTASPAPGGAQSRRDLKAKAEPPPTRKPFERPKAPPPEALSIPAPNLIPNPAPNPTPNPVPTVAPSPSLALAMAQNEPPSRRDPEVVVDPTPAPQVTAPSPRPAPFPLVGGWSYPSNGRFYGAEPEFVELAIREDNGHLMGALSVRFKPASGTESGLLQFGFSGDVRSASMQTFSVQIKNGDRGTIELIPGSAPNMLEVNFHVPRSDGKTQSGNMILVKKAASSL
jgi:hypothetical protein